MPVSAVLMGKILGGVLFGLLMTTVVTIGSGIILGIYPHILSFAAIIIISCFVFSTLGALLCVLVKEVFEAQTLLNLPRFIMIFLCGVVYPISKMPVWLQYISYVMPLTYTVEGLHNSFSLNSTPMILKDISLLIVYFLLFIFPAIYLLTKKFE